MAVYLAGDYTRARPAAGTARKGAGTAAITRPSKRVTAAPDGSTPFFAVPAAGRAAAAAAGRHLPAGGSRSSGGGGGGRGGGGGGNGAFGRRVESIFERALSIRREVERELQRGGQAAAAESVKSDHF